MTQPKFITDVMVLLEKHAANQPLPEITDELIEEFGEKAKDILRKMQKGREDKGFKLYFSNIGQDARKLWLEKEYGRVPMDSFTTFKMKYGDLIEQFLVTLLKAANVDVTDVDKDIQLMVGDTEIRGRMDLKVDGNIVDIKTASTYAYDTKFDSLKSMQAKDDFGYCSQGVGYMLADGSSKFSGWLVIDKVSGHFKFVDAMPLNTLPEIQKTLNDFEYKINVINGVTPVPECAGIVDEYYNRKATGRKTLSSSCNYCPHKSKCHPSLTYEPVAGSTAKEKPWRYYVNTDMC